MKKGTALFYKKMVEETVSIVWYEGVFEMKKIISSILIMILFIITLEVNVYAQNGPIQDESQIWFEEEDNYNNYKRVYEENTEYN